MWAQALAVLGQSLFLTFLPAKSTYLCQDFKDFKDFKRRHISRVQAHRYRRWGDFP